MLSDAHLILLEYLGTVQIAFRVAHQQEIYQIGLLSIHLLTFRDSLSNYCISLVLLLRPLNTFNKATVANGDFGTTLPSGDTSHIPFLNDSVAC